MILKTIPSKILNQSTVQKPGAGIELNTECNDPIKIINSQFSINSIADQRKKATTKKPIFDAVVDFSYDCSVLFLSC